MTDPERSAGSGLALALRRVVVGYRVVAMLWVWLLATVVLVTEGDDVHAGLVLATVLLATLWTLATVSVGARAAVVLRSPWWIAADIAVSAGVILLSGEAQSVRGFTGGYPFSTILIASYGGGYPGGFFAALVLSGVSVASLAGTEAVSSSLVYLAGAGVTVWAIDVMRRYEIERRALEADLAAEQAERARSQERADTAAALHDSVLQTLALIQRRNDDPAAVATLARRQERDLRDWLVGRGVLGGSKTETFAEAAASLAAEIEGDYPVTVEVVTVGDRPLDERLRALVAAGREATVNAAKHAGVATVSVYAEVDDGEATLFIRDRGAGFDPATVPVDRRGIRESIQGRMQRCGGTADIRSSAGSGTEVELRLPLSSEA